MSTLLEMALELPIPERIKLVGDIWDSIAAEPWAMKLTPEQTAEIERRLEDYRKNPDDSVPWEEVKERFRQKST
jgi:putative addiction module component (TIGR02574 family)